MFLDCKTCGYQSPAFNLLGEAVIQNQQLKNLSYDEGIKVEVSETGELTFYCPSGHPATYLPTMLKFAKRSPEGNFTIS